MRVKYSVYQEISVASEFSHSLRTKRTLGAAPEAAIHTAEPESLACGGSQMFFNDLLLIQGYLLKSRILIM